MSIRQEFVLRALARQQSIAELCREYGVSRKTAYKWLRRFQAEGSPGLVDQSRRPLTNPLAVKPELVVEIIRLKQKHRTWGAKKLWVVLSRTTPGADLPSPSTINRVLRGSGMVVRRRRYRQPSHGLPVRPSVVVNEPNDLWTADFKGWWHTGDGARCEPLTVRDAFSRYVLELRIMRRTNGASVRKVFEQLFDRFGLPRAIQTDNGSPFASTRALAGLTALSAWWVSLGIDVVRSRPGRPTDNGGHERMHADIRVDIEQDAADSLRSQQRVCDEWRAEFNCVRPHEALDMRTPGDVYKPSPRRPSRVIVGGYPECCQLVMVRHGGMIRPSPASRDARNGGVVYVSLGLRGHLVGIEQRDDGFSYVWFFDRLLGRFEPGKDDTVLPIFDPKRVVA